MVQTKSKPRVQRQRLQVQRIFRVKLNAFQSRPDTPYFWLQLEGPRENMGKAKVNSVWPPITSSQTFLPPFARLPSPSPLPPPNPGRQGSPGAPRPGPGSMAGRYWAMPCLSTSAALGPSLWFLLSFLPHPSVACHFGPSSVLRKALRRVSPQEPSLARGPRLQTMPPSGEQLKVWYFCSLCSIPLCSPPRGWKAQVFLPSCKSP